jgi:hypothetical protein
METASFMKAYTINFPGATDKERKTVEASVREAVLSREQTPKSRTNAAGNSLTNTIGESIDPIASAGTKDGDGR